jgi:hypothetical protein
MSGPLGHRHTTRADVVQLATKPHPLAFLVSAEELPWRTAFRVFALRLRALASLLLALQLRRMASPKAQGLRRFSKCNYSRDLRPAKWASMINLRCKKSWTVLVRFGSWLFSNSGRALALPGDGCCGAWPQADVSAVIL